MGLRANLNTTAASTTTKTKATTATRAKLKPTGKMIINGIIVNREQQQQQQPQTSSATTQNANQAQQKTNNLFKKICQSKKTCILPQTVAKKCSTTTKKTQKNNSESAVKLKMNTTEKSKQENDLGKLVKYERNKNENHVDDDDDDDVVDDAEEEEEEEEEEDDNDDEDDDEEKDEETTCITTTMMTTTTFRSSSASALLANSMRPQTLNVQQLRLTPTNQTQSFFGEVLNAWRAKARCNVVPAERTLELFHELNFHPSEKQISEMLQTAKMLACKNSRQANGLTFGEFCVLAADLKRFRTSAFSPSICNKVSLINSADNESAVKAKACYNHTTMGKELRSTKSFSSVDDCTKKKKTSITDATPPVEVFLGGSCNPTTWRADVAIPALNELGISFYNPQVSEWTPDLIELEHRAKEKARVLFFVMDSETRASAGAIEVAHIAGQNCKQLVLVLHPYKPNQTILNERISQQEYLDLIRNQMILRELVTRRGLPVMENIPSGLQRTKDLLAGIRPPPSNIASILVVVRGAFDRVNPINDVIGVQKCQRALLYLGYAQSLLGIENLKKIIAKQRDSQNALLKQQQQQNNENCSKSNEGKIEQQQQNEEHINFDLFCTISAYLSVLQQEIQESGCISPIKGTNVPPPPVYLTNMQGNESFSLSYFGKNISRTSSNTSVPEERQIANKDLLSRSRDSGTSSPQPHEQQQQQQQQQQQAARRGVQKQKSQQQIMVNYESIETTTTEITTTKTLTTKQITNPSSGPTTTSSGSHSNNNNNNNAVQEEESDSNDSVFSSNSSINSVTCGGSADDLLNCTTAPPSLPPTTTTTTASGNNIDFCDVYLGGSCMLRTKWRQDCAIPYLKSKSVNYHLPALHESLQLEQMVDYPTPAETVGTQARSYTRTRRKCKGAELSSDKEESRISWTLPQMRSTLYNPLLLDSSRVLLFVITNETRSLAPMTLAAHCIGLMYNVVLCVQMLPEDCHIGKEKLTPLAIKDYNRARSYLIDLAMRQGVPVFNDLKAALECTVQKVNACTSRHQCD